MTQKVQGSHGSGTVIIYRVEQISVPLFAQDIDEEGGWLKKKGHEQLTKNQKNNKAVGKGRDMV